MNSQPSRQRLGALTFRPHLEERVWGGRRLERYGRKLPDKVLVGETWEVSAIPGRSSVVARGPRSGRPFDEVFDEYRDEILGDAQSTGVSFPLLLKLLDAAAPLSVQLHPNDEEALAIEGPGVGSIGKSEVWIILSAEPQARIVHGLDPRVNPRDLYDRLEDLEGKALTTEEEESLFRWVSVKSGDIVFVPTGSVHALGTGIVMAEVQQNSDLTYRLYDWGRRDSRGRYRQLHLDKALRVGSPGEITCPLGNIEDLPTAAGIYPLADCEKFRLDLISMSDGSRWTGSTDEGGDRNFHILFGWSGTTRYTDSSGDVIEISPVSFVVLPASLGSYELEAITPEARCLRITPS